MKLKSIILALLAIASLSANASKAIRYFKDITLNDGRVVSATLTGDENISYYITSAGEVVLYNAEGDYYYAASQAQKDSLKARYAELAEQSSKARGVNSAKLTGTTYNGRLSGSRLFPCTGTPKVPVILIEFTDMKFTYTKDEIDEMLNSTEIKSNSEILVKDKDGNTMVGKSKGSVAEYFNHSSGGAFRPVFDVYGIYEIGKTAAYYSGKESTCIVDACKLAENDVDFAEYDQDNDGYLDLVYIIYAGYGQAWGNSNTIWPKVTYTTGSFGTVDGVKIHRGGLSNEINYTPAINEQVFGDADAKQLSGIGVFCHEFCHTLGITDFYPNNGGWDYSLYDNQSMEEWSLMDGGENRINTFLPTPLSGFERYLFGWIEDIDELSEADDVTLTPLLNDGKIYKITGNNDNEYWILEAIPADDAWYYGFKKNTGTGMVVTHINTGIKSFSLGTMPNSTAGNPGFTIVPADGRLIGYYNENSEAVANYYKSLLGDPFPGSQSVTSLTDYWAKDGTIDKPITEITQNSDYSVSFKFMGGTTGINAVKDVDQAKQPTKYIKDGKIVIVKDGKTYNSAGAEVK